MPEDMRLYSFDNKKKKGLFNNRLLLALVLIIVIVAGGAILYLYLSLQGVIGNVVHPTEHYPPIQMTASIAEQDMLVYKNQTQYIPYVLIGYSVTNVTSINLNASLYKYPPPTRIFILNISNECYQCGNTSQIEGALYQRLIQYQLIRRASQISIVSPQLLRSLPNDSILIVLNGLMPETFFEKDNTSITTMQYLLQRHTSIIYTGYNFTRVLLPDSIITPNPNPPTYFQTLAYYGNYRSTNNFYLNSSVFAFENASLYNRFLTFKNVFNGSVVAFPNVPTAWKYPNETGYDIAKAIKEEFWLPKYAFGTRTVAVNGTSGEAGVLMNSIAVGYNPKFVYLADTGYVGITVTANATYPTGTSNNTYRYLYSAPQLYYNGSIYMPNSIVTNTTVPLEFQINTRSNVLTNVEPHISVYTLDSKEVYTTPLPFIHNISGNFTFFTSKILPLTPGTPYILKLDSFYGTEYGAALINISPIELTLLSANASTDQFLFRVTSNGQAVSNLNYVMTLNGQYPNNGVIRNGEVYYNVPSGTQTIIGTLVFDLNVMGSTTYYLTGYHPLPFKLNDQYIEIGAVIIVMLIMIVLVRAPNVDDFYIDVPNLPEAKKTEIKLKAKEIVSVFDKLNTLYHWKYMPLSDTEIKYAISNYMRYNNFPVGLTYNNIESVVDPLTVNGYLVSADGLYAPSQWEQTSQHDIEYLATFKKLRIYLVTHAYIFTDLDMSTNADIVTTIHNERKYIILYSKTTKFKHVPIYSGSKTYLAFLNSYALETFKQSLYSTPSAENEELKMYMAFGYLKLVDADNPEELLS